MICNNNYFADILRVGEIKDLIWVTRFQSPYVYLINMVFVFRLFIIDQSQNTLILTLTYLLSF